MIYLSQNLLENLKLKHMNMKKGNNTFSKHQNEEAEE